MATIDLRPPALDVTFRPGNDVELTLVWPTDLTGRTFTATVGGDDLDVSIDEETMVLLADEAFTSALTGDAEFVLTETTDGTDVLLIGRWTPSTSPGSVSTGGSVSVVAGSASFSSAGPALTVTNTPNAIINWRGFSIGAGEITRFQQQSASSAVLNRVVGQDPSAILGTLSSNGRVFLVNPLTRDERQNIVSLTLRLRDSRHDDPQPLQTLDPRERADD